MFYLKHNGEKLEVDHENVYTICPQCGVEHSIDLSDILRCEHADLYSTAVYCERCSAEREAARGVIPFPDPTCKNL